LISRTDIISINNIKHKATHSLKILFKLEHILIAVKASILYFRSSSSSYEYSIDWKNDFSIIKLL